ncbi:MAG: hypothetical protein K0R57_4711 [Paenibacillaceae bacterium]|jgi:alpha-tubulin suppressor-like RCC1 family protein|nr:hypothetical protein [Paenibacillaceae bacterium]
MGNFPKSIMMLIFGVLLLPSATIAETSDEGLGHQGWQTMSSGGSHRLAVKKDGTAWSWGSNGAGQLGIGQLDTSQMSSVQVASLRDITIVGTGNLN